MTHADSILTEVILVNIGAGNGLLIVECLRITSNTQAFARTNVDLP